MRFFSLILCCAFPGWAAAADTPASEGTEAEGEAEWDISAHHGPHHSAAFSLSEGTWMSVDLHGDRLVFDLLGDLWTLPLGGGSATRLTEGAAWDSQPRFSADGRRIAFVSDRGGNEQIWTMNADGTGAEAFTDEDEARVTDPVWDPAGAGIIGRRRTVDTRSIGVTELWLYHPDGGSGVALTSKDDHPHAAEATLSADGRWMWFSSRHGRFTYDENPVGGLWDVVQLDRQSGEERAFLWGAGSAVRPTLSPDQRTLAFVSRQREKTLLEVVDVASGDRRVVADWLSHDQMEGFALHGVYPTITWTPDNRGLVLWAQGKLWRVGLGGERTEIPFQADGAWDFQDVPRVAGRIGDEVVAKVIRWPRESKGRLAFSAMGQLWLREADGTQRRLSDGMGFSPAWSPDGSALAWTSWQDGVDGAQGSGGLHIRQGRRVEDLPVRGQLVNPAWSADGKRLVVLRAHSGSPNPDLGAAGWNEVLLLEKQGRSWVSRVVGQVDNRGAQARATRLYLLNDRVWFFEDRSDGARKADDLALVSMNLEGRDRITHALFEGAQDVALSPDGRRVAFVENFQAKVAWLPPFPREVSIKGGEVPVRQLSEVQGEWLEWSADGQRLSWMEGPVRKTLAVSSLAEPEEEEAEVLPTEDLVELRVPRARPSGVLALTHARVITMEGQEVIDDATVVIEGDRIASVQAGGPVPAGAQVRDLSGKTVIPGLIDVHAHLHYTAGDVLPEQEWRYKVNLDFGVTTVHDPSASTHTVFTQGERVAAGLMSGPRVFSTGFVLYGALGNDNAPTATKEDALAHVQRLKAVGAGSVKVYQQSRRDQRQWYVDACNAEGMLCVAEGGGDLFMNLGMVADGMHAIEHSLPIAPLYADVRQWMAASQTESSRGSAYTPTLLVAYGGLSGEGFFFQHDNPVDHPLLRKNHPIRMLEARTWRTSLSAQDADWNHQAVARDAAAMADAGALVSLGAHGQLQGLGVHWEMWALGGPGAMTPHQALRAATVGGAEYLGMEAELGSIAPGKLADLVVLGADPLVDIRNSTAIELVIKNGEVWE